MKKYIYTPKSKWKPALKLVLAIIIQMQRKLKKTANVKITFNWKFVGSKKKKIITNIINEPFDFDINLELGKKTKVIDEDRIINLIKKSIPSQIEKYKIAIHNNKRSISIKILNNDNTTYFKIDFAVTKIKDNKIEILVKDKNSYIWNVINEKLDKLKIKEKEIKAYKASPLLRDEYIKLKNTDDSLDSYIIYIMAVNNTLNNIQNQEKEKNS